MRHDEPAPPESQQSKLCITIGLLALAMTVI